MYPISKLILTHLDCSNVAQARVKLAHHLKLSNANKAFNRADDMLAGRVKPNMALFLARSIGAEHRVVLRAIEQTIQQKHLEEQAEYQRNIEPHIFVKTSGKITQVVFAAMTHNNLKIIKVDKSILQQPIKQQLEVVSSVMIKHNIDHPDRLAIFGRIIGYTYYPDHKHSYPFNQQGKLKDLHEGDNNEKLAVATLRGKNFNLI